MANSAPSPRPPAPAPAGAGRARAAGTRWRWAWALEGLVGLALAELACLRFGRSLPGLDAVAVVVLLLGARFGYVLGAAAGLAAGALDLAAAGVSPAHMLDPAGGRAALLGAFVKLLAGVLGGLIGDAHRQATAQARAEAQGTREKLVQLTRRHKVLAEAKEALDRRVVGQLHTVSSLYEGAKELEVLDPQAIAPAALRLTARFLDAEAVALYGLRDGRLLLEAALGDGPERPEALSPDAGLVGEAWRAKRAVGLHAEVVPGDSPMALVAPLLDAAGSVRGVIVVEQLPFLRLTPDALVLLELVADWVSRALANSEAFVASQGRSYLEPTTGAPTAAFMAEQIAREWSVATRYDLPLSLMLVRRPSLAGMSASERGALASQLVGELKQRLRQMDQVGHYRTEDSFVVVLPVTALPQAEMLAQRFREALGPEVIVACGAAGGRLPSAEALLQKLQGEVFAAEGRLHAR